MIDLERTLCEHAGWLSGGGERADLSGANLSMADLSGANLSMANLSMANLSMADLRDANLRVANLSMADLRDANLRDANLRWADLRGANLRGANLSMADLRRANLRGANLRGVNLPSPPAMLLARWGGISGGLTALAMAYDAACHPDPEAFTRWADGGDCPYDGVRVQRACSFEENEDLWDPDLAAPRPFDLMVALIRECCADSDYHDKGESK